MSNEYNIDDLLAEIKERKSREKGRTSPTTEAEQETPSFRGSSSRASGSSAPKTEEDMYRTTFDAIERLAEENATKKKLTTPEDDFFNFTEPVKPVSEPETTGASFDFGAFDNIAPLGSGRKPNPTREPQGYRPEPTIHNVSEVKEDISHKEEVPLAFGGQPRSLSDRAKVRGSYRDLAEGRGDGERGQRPPIKKLDFQSLGDTSAVEQIPPGTGNPTNVTHQFSPVDATGQSIELEDIKRMDFEATSQTNRQDIYYEDYHNYDYGEGGYLSFREYRPNTDRKDISLEIARTKVWMFVRTALTALFSFFLFYFVFSGKFGWLPLPRALFPYPETMKSFVFASVVLTSLVILVNIKVIANSIFNLFRMRANSETLASLALIASLVQGIIAVRNPELVQPEKLNLYFAIAALTMLFTCIGRLTMLGRIQANFNIVSSKLPKKGVMSVESNGFCHDVVAEDTDNRPTVAYAAYADFFSDFLSLSFSDRYDVGINRSVAPVCLFAALIVMMGTHLLAGGIFPAVSALTAALSIGATLSVAFIDSIPLSKLAKRLTPYGCMVSGNKAVENFCDTHSVILNDTDLFPEGSIALYGIKAFENTKLDEAILETASVLCQVDGALSPLFLEMIGGNRELLKPVKEVVYESGMGVSAWIDDKRILIGNRLLMQNHGVMLPHDTYERENPGDPPGNPIYISNSGQVSARFLVNYNIDEELAYQLDQLGLQNRHIIVHTSDANINEQKVWELYGYPLELITILPTDLHDEYREMAQQHEELPAEIVYTGSAANYIAGILGAISARASILSATVFQLIQIVLGYGVVAFMAFMGFIGNLSVVQMLIYMVFWFTAIIIIQKTRRT